jgi:hypothetical protein
VSSKLIHINKKLAIFKDKHIIAKIITNCATINKGLTNNSDIMLANTVRNHCHMGKILITLKRSGLTLVQKLNCFSNFEKKFCIIIFNTLVLFFLLSVNAWQHKSYRCHLACCYHLLDLVYHCLNC